MRGWRGPLFYLDTHAGRGLYDLASAEALRAGEFRTGIARVAGRSDAPEAMRPYLDTVARLNSGGPVLSYPGSPLIAAGLLRKGDRTLFCELQGDELDTLKTVLRPFAFARAESHDGYRALGRLLPPKEGQGLVFIDPPFEAAREFGNLAAALNLHAARWPHGALLAWYPLKEANAGAALATALELPDGLSAMRYELRVAAEGSRSGMLACGLIAFNLPPGFETAMRSILAYLASRLAIGEGAGLSVSVVSRRGR